MGKIYLFLILVIGVFSLNAQELQNQMLVQKLNVQSAELKQNKNSNPTEKIRNSEATQTSKPRQQVANSLLNRSLNQNQGLVEMMGDKKEIVEKREYNSKTFDNGDGTMTTLIGIGAIHYRKNGQFLDISTKIIPNQQPGFSYANTTNLFESYYGTTSNNGVKSKIHQGELLEFINTKMYWEVNGQAVGTISSNNSNIIVENDKAIYPNLYGTISAEFTSYTGRRELNYIIPDRQALGVQPQGASYLVFTEDIILPIGWSAEESLKGVYIKNHLGEKLFLYENPNSFDQNNPLGLRQEENTIYESSVVGQTLHIKTKVKTSWLLSNERQFPINVDPTVNLYSNNAEWWSGYTIEDGDGCGSGNLIVGLDNNGKEIDGFAKFNITGIPTGMNIVGVRARLYHFLSSGVIDDFNTFVIGLSNANPPSQHNCATLYNSFYYNATNEIEMKYPGDWGYINGNFTQNGITQFVNSWNNNGYITILPYPVLPGWYDSNDFGVFAGYFQDPSVQPYLEVTYSNDPYCIPTTESPTNLYINQIKFVGTLNPNDIVNNSTYSTGFQDFTNLADRAVQVQGGVVNISARAGGWRGRFKAWVDWNQNGVFDSNELVYDMGGIVGGSTLFGFIVPENQAPGDYRIRIRVQNTLFLGIEFGGFDFSPCEPFELDTFGGDYGEAEDYMFTVIADCPPKITGVNVNPGDGEKCFQGGNPFAPITISASGSAGTVGFNWYDAEFGGNLLQHDTASTYSAGVGTTTTYWVTAYNNSCETVYRTPVVARVKPSTTIDFEITEGEVCGFESHIKIHSSGDIEEYDLVNEKFDNNLGEFKNVTEGYDDPAIDSKWRKVNSPYKVPIPPYFVLTPALASGQTGGPFAIIVTDAFQNSDIINSLELTNAVDASDISDLKLEFDLFYRPFFENTSSYSYFRIEVNTGNGWNTLQTITNEIGNPGKFARQSIDMSAYQVSNLKIRFKIFSSGGDDGWIGDVAAIDNVRLYGDRALSTQTNWTGIDPNSMFQADCTTPYTGLTDEICLKPTDAQLESNVAFDLNVSAVLSNGCSATGFISIPNNSKVWNPADNSDDWTATNKWKPSTPVPTANNCVIVKKQLNLVANKNGLARNITVVPGGKLNLKANSSLKITDFVRNNAAADDFVVEHNGSLIQINNNAVNTGDITVEKEFNFSALRKEYNFVSLPVANQNIKTIYTPNSPNVQEYNEATDYMPNTNGPYIVGKGYALKEAPGSGVQTVIAKYQSVPNNGIITFNLKKEFNGYNLIGNPYPSDLDISKMRNNNAAKMASTIFFWDNRNNQTHQQMGPNYDQNQYAIFNTQSIGGNPATQVAPNTPSSGANSKKPTKFIKPGTGFIVQALQNNVPLEFKNEYRDKGTSPNFFGKNAEEGDGEEEFYSDRYWLNLITPANMMVTNLVTYFEGGNDDFWDDDSEAGGGSDDIYTYAGNKQVAIQGKRPFSDDDQVQLGYRAYSAGYHTIAIDEVEGVFEDEQDIYIIDHLLNKTWNLSTEPYRFNSRSGEFNNRFTIVYKPSNNQPSFSNLNTINMSKVDNKILVSSSLDKITSIEVFDLNSRPVYSKTNVNAKSFKIDSKALNNQIVVVTVKTDKGEFVSKKFVNN